MGPKYGGVIYLNYIVVFNHFLKVSQVYVAITGDNGNSIAQGVGNCLGSRAMVSRGLASSKTY